MATLASPMFDRYFGRAPLPPGSVPDAPVDPKRVGIIWYIPRQEMPAAHPAPASRQASAAPAADRAAAPRPQAAQPPTPPPPTRPTSLGAPPPEPSPQRTGQRRIAPEPPRRPKELDWLTWQLSENLHKRTKEGLRETLRWRARQCDPLPPPQRPVERARFGLWGEPLEPESTPTLRALLYSELREIVRTVEAPLSWSQRNYRLVMHSTRLGQLCRELEQRGADDVLEIIRAGLALLWE